MRVLRDVLRRLTPALLPALAAAPARGDPVLAPPPAEPERLLAIAGFVLLVVLLAWGLGRHARDLRADFVRLIAGGEGAGTDRLALFRDAPAGLPEGSVRAALAVAIVLLALPALVLSGALGLGGTGELGTILGGVLGFYFGARGTGGEAEAARRQAGDALREAAAAEAARDAAQSRAARQARGAGEAASRLETLSARAAEGAAAARAIAALLPAGPAAATLAGAGTALAEAARAGAAIGTALETPSEATVAAAVEATAAALRATGEGTELAGALGGALHAVREATGAAAALREAVADPSPATLAAALSGAARVAGAAGDGGLAGALAPALGMLGSAMRLPGMAGALGATGPAGVAAGVMLGAWGAARLGRQHYARWMARVLDRPVTPDLFPGGTWDGEAARALLEEVPPLAAALAARLAPEAPQDAAAAALRRLLEPGAAAWAFALAPSAFASEAEAEAAVAHLRRRVLDAELDRAPVQPGAEEAELPPLLPLARLRADLDRLREAGAGGAIDSLALLADGLIQARPAPPDLPALLRRALAVAEAPGRALERAPAPAPALAEAAP